MVIVGLVDASGSVQAGSLDQANINKLAQLATVSSYAGAGECVDAVRAGASVLAWLAHAVVNVGLTFIADKPGDALTEVPGGIVGTRRAVLARPEGTIVGNGRVGSGGEGGRVESGIPCGTRSRVESGRLSGRRTGVGSRVSSWVSGRVSSWIRGWVCGRKKGWVQGGGIRRRI